MSSSMKWNWASCIHLCLLASSRKQQLFFTVDSDLLFSVNFKFFCQIPLFWFLNTFFLMWGVNKIWKVSKKSIYCMVLLWLLFLVNISTPPPPEWFEQNTKKLWEMRKKSSERNVNCMYGALDSCLSPVRYCIIEDLWESTITD